MQRRKAGIYEQSLVSHRQRERFGPKHCGGCTRIRRSARRHKPQKNRYKQSFFTAARASFARDTKRLDDLVKKYGDSVRAVPLDVTNESAAQAAVQTAVAAFGRLDVVVNNAGYGDIAPFEQLSAERFKAVMDTNFYGVVNVTRAAVPLMREQRSGCILQISSVGGRLTRPGSTPYHAAKWAVGGFTESLAQELSPFGVKVCALEPGGMRTNWGARANQDTPELLPDYEPSVGAVAKALKSYWGKEIMIPPR